MKAVINKNFGLFCFAPLFSALCGKFFSKSGYAFARAFILSIKKSESRLIPGTGGAA
jgi:hypothetical protein